MLHLPSNPMPGPLMPIQAVIVFIAGISGDAIVAAAVSGFFVVVNGIATVLLTRWLEITWKKEVRQELKEEKRIEEKKDESSTPRVPS